MTAINCWWKMRCLVHGVLTTKHTNTTMTITSTSFLPVQKAVPKTAECTARLLRMTACQLYGVLTFSGTTACKWRANHPYSWPLACTTAVHNTSHSQQHDNGQLSGMLTASVNVSLWDVRSSTTYTHIAQVLYISYPHTVHNNYGFKIHALTVNITASYSTNDCIFLYQSITSTNTIYNAAYC